MTQSYPERDGALPYRTGLFPEKSLFYRELR